MANIPLRSYIREIEGFIDSGQLEETVAHCRHILQSYPKQIDTYRLLGKLFLEARQFTNASDILQRVLSAVPDDFVSHVGMSIIREDEGNLDASIWHMERAFENQPANKAIQDELRRLFGRRDGMEPPKIRLTRGALARMYAKGNLYDQAIGELRGALSEDPQRPDLQVLLAEMNYLSGNRVEAVETSSNLLKKFPFCLIANRILAIILPQTDRAEDAKIYQQRAFALDPYLQKADSEALTSADVPDSAVMLDSFDLTPGQPVTGLPEQPAWAASLGIKFEEAEEEQLPDWLSEDLEIPAYEGQQVAPFIEGEADDGQLGEKDETEDLIPEWMQDAGWQPSSGEDVESQPYSELYEAEESDVDIEKADIPDWLKEIAPSDEIEGEVAVDEGSKDEIPTWLDESPPGPTDSIVSWLSEKDEIGELETEDLFESAEDVEVPDWLQELEEQPTPEEFDTTPEEMESTLEIEDETTSDTDFIQKPSEEGLSVDEETSQPADVKETEPTGDLPEWLEDIEDQESDERTGVTDWLVNADTSPTQESELDTILNQDLKAEKSEIDLPDWLEDIAEEGGEEEIESISEEAAQKETEAPEWMGEFEDTSEGEIQPEAAISEMAPEKSADYESIEITEEQVEAEISEEQIKELNLEDQDAALAWLESLAAKQGAAEEELITLPEERRETPPEWIIEEEISTQEEEVSEPPSETELPEWLRETEDEISEDIQTSPEVSEIEEVETDFAEEDSALAWLEGLAAKQGVSEEELITQPEDRLEKPPEWVLEDKEDVEVTEETPLDMETPSEISPDLDVSGEKPKWIPEIQEAEDKTQEIAIEEPISEEEAPSRLTPEEVVPVDINTASLTQLEKIPGIGFVLAQNITEYREENGPFDDLHELKNVPGIGAVNFETFKDHLIIEEIVVHGGEFEEPEISSVEILDKDLSEAESALETEDIERAVNAYDNLIKRGQHLDLIISQLEKGLARNPENIQLWQTLGDAYMRNNQFQQALNAYTKAEKLL